MEDGQPVFADEAPGGAPSRSCARCPPGAVPPHVPAHRGVATEEPDNPLDGISHDGSCATRTTQPSGEDSPRVSVLEPGGRGLRGPLTSSAIVCRDGRISSGSRRRWLHRGPLGCGSRCGGSEVRGVDLRPLEEWYQRPEGVELLELDLRRADDCRQAVEGARQVYNLAADMGGMGFIELNKALCMLSVLINTHMLEASLAAGVERFFFSSSACVYAEGKAGPHGHQPALEEDAYPAMPEDGYGWEKLFSERMCRHFTEDFGLESRVARYHNVYGPKVPSRAGGKRRLPRFAARSRRRSSAAGTRSTSGVMASRRAASCTSTTVFTGRSCSWSRT